MFPKPLLRPIKIVWQPPQETFEDIKSLLIRSLKILRIVFFKNYQLHLSQRDLDIWQQKLVHEHCSHFPPVPIFHAFHRQM